MVNVLRSFKNFNTKGFSFVEVIVGTALLLIVFLGIFGAYQLGVKVIGQNKARIIANAIANQKIEFIRNLSYNDIGTAGGIPSGNIPQAEIIARNNIEYTVRTVIIYVDDPFDGLAPDDALPNDYKRAKVEVSWRGLFGGKVVLITDVSPKGLETSVGGGNLLISVFDAFGSPVAQADVHLVNASVTPPVDANYQTNDQGQILIAGAASSTQNYQITVSKTGYSVDRTYGTEEVANPETPHATVLEGKLTQTSFSIDKTGSFSIDTFSPWGTDSFSDSFVDASKVSEFSDVLINGGEVTLASTTSGYLISSSVAPSNLASWDNFSWNDSEPINADISYQVFYSTSTAWALVPDNDLPGNSSGFNSFPVDLSGLATSTYYQLKLKGNFSSINASTTPTLFDWQVSWRTSEPSVIPNAAFHLRGEKIIGTDINEDPVYKYSKDHVSDGSGHIDISGLEWDSYTFSVDKILTGLDLVDIDPFPQPIDLLPNSSQSVALFLSAENSLLATVKDRETSEDIFSAEVRVFNASIGYDKTLLTSGKGEALFIPLDSNTYNYEVQASGYQSSSGSVSVAGNTTKIIYLTPGEI